MDNNWRPPTDPTRLQPPAAAESPWALPSPSTLPVPDALSSFAPPLSPLSSSPAFVAPPLVSLSAAPVPAAHAAFAPGAELQYPDTTLPTYVAAPATGRRRGKMAGIVAAGVMLLGGAGTAMALRSASDAGAASPTAAVQKLMDSIEAGDWLAALETMPKGERQLYAKVMEQSLSEAKRLGLVSDVGTLRKVAGLKIDFQNVTMDSTPVNDRIANVDVTSGTIVADVHVKDLPIGDVLNRLIQKNNITLTDKHSDETAVPSDRNPITTVKDDEGWHVSLLYTIGEAARGDMSMPEPIAAVGAASPEKAVEELVRAAFKADATRVVQLIDPEEGAVVHDYGQLAIDAINGFEVDTTSPEWPVLEELTLTSKKGEFGTVVSLKHAIAHATTFDGQVERYTIDIDGSCTSIIHELDGVADTKKVCAKDVQSMLPTSGAVCDIYGPGVSGVDTSGADTSGSGIAVRDSSCDLGLMPTVFLDIVSRSQANAYSSSGLVTRQVNGSWYVSPGSSVFEALFSFSHLVQRSDLEKLLVD